MMANAKRNQKLTPESKDPTVSDDLNAMSIKSKTLTVVAIIFDRQC